MLEVGYVVKGNGTTCPVWVFATVDSKPWLHYRSGKSGGMRILGTKDFDECVKLIPPFCHLTSSGVEFYPWSDTMKALVQFLFLFHESIKDFVDFKSVDHPLPVGLSSLVRALQAISDQQPSGQESNHKADPSEGLKDGDEVTKHKRAASGSSGDDGEGDGEASLFVPERKKKRTHEQFLEDEAN